MTVGRELGLKYDPCRYPRTTGHGKKPRVNKRGAVPSAVGTILLISAISTRATCAVFRRIGGPEMTITE